MRRFLVLALVGLLGIAPLSVRSVWAQGEPDEAWANVARPTVGAPLEQLDDLRGLLEQFGSPSQRQTESNIRDRLVKEPPQTGYVVTFLDNYAHVPEIPTAEQMAIFIRSGEFVLDNSGPAAFTVVPAGHR